MSKNKKNCSGKPQKKTGFKGNPYKKVRYCDPGACRCCQCICNGDFLIYRDGEWVWENAQWYKPMEVQNENRPD